jgi:hypothetical protein
VFFRSAKSSGAMDAQLRESYRRRLDEIFASSAETGAEPEPPSYSTATALADPEPEAEAVLPGEPPPCVPVVVERLAEAPRATGVELHQASEKIALNLTACWSAAMRDMERRRETEVSRRLESLARATESQAEGLEKLRATVAQVLEAQRATQSQLDTQVELVRQLGATAGAQQSTLNQYRSAVERLRDVAAAPCLPVTLPDNL